MGICNIILKILTYGERPPGSEAYLEARDAEAKKQADARAAIKKSAAKPVITADNAYCGVDDYLNAPLMNIDGTLMMGQTDINGNFYGVTNQDH